MLQHEYEVLILESHLDTFGHVNNAAYLALFEEARWDIVHSRGYGLKKVQETHIGPTLLEVNLQFRREILLRERIKIKTSVLEHNRKTTKLSQVMFNEKGEEACAAVFTIGLFDLRLRKLIEPTPEWSYAIGLP